MFARILILLLGVLPAAAADAATFEPRRGLSLDIWLTWPNEDRWDEREFMLPFPEWKRSIGADELRALKDSGLDFLRIPVDPAPLLSEETVALRGELIDGVVEAAQAVNDAGLKAIVDLHAIPAADRTVDTPRILAGDTLFDRYAELVGTIAGRLRDADPRTVALEVLNEPVSGCEGDEAARWTSQLKRLHAAARAAAPDLTLVLSGACWGSAEGLAALDPKEFADDNILWSFHSYDPFLLSHQGAGWAGDFIPYVTGLPFPLHSIPRAELDARVEAIRDRMRAEAPILRRAGMIAYLDEQVAALDTEAEMSAAIAAPFARVAEWARSHGMAPGDILLGEFGMIRQAWGVDHVVPAAERARFYRALIDEAERRGFAWSMWSYGSDFGVVDEFEGRKAETDVMDMVRALPAR